MDHIDLLQDLEKTIRIQSVVLSKEDTLSTGLLCLDLITGGIKPGMYVIAGGEQSAKTTTAINTLGALINQNVEFATLWDAENSTGSSLDYVESIFKTSGLEMSAEELFGVKKDGRYTQKPRVYYRDEGEMDTFFGWTAALLRRLPDKRYEDGKWWYVYEASRENKAKYKHVMDRHRSAGDSGVYIPADDGGLQAVILVDSLPALLPSAMDEDEVKSGMALQAREFSKHLPRVKGKLRSKRVALIAINQLRTAPGVMYGCFAGWSSVMMADGSTKTIREIVDGRLPGPVLSITKDGKVEPKPIVDWFNNGSTNHWVNLTVEDYKAEITCTAGHKIRMFDGSFKRADELELGDLLAALSEDGSNVGRALTCKRYTSTDDLGSASSQRFDIKIEGNSTYCVENVFVHNSPEYEPGGMSIRFNSDCRIHNKSRALSGVPFNPKGKGQIEEEPSIFGEGLDTYRYVHSKAIKNKLAVPNRETWLRIWISDQEQAARGFDPVWDTFYAMFLTGQVSGKRHQLRLNVHGMGAAKKTIDWQDFKLLILGDKDQVGEVCARIGYKTVNLRKGMFNLFKRGVLEDLYIANLKNANKSKDAVEEESDDDSDD